MLARLKFGMLLLLLFQPCSIAAMLMVLLYTTTTTKVLLQFDGSLLSRRTPSGADDDDDIERRMHTCAACLFVNGQLHGLGGRRFIGPITTAGELGVSPSLSSSSSSSAIAEYEGLLYGLEQLLKFLDNRHNNINNDPVDENTSSSSAVMIIEVQGDCKTVMEHMQGRARPRKLARYHQRATSLLEKLMERGDSNVTPTDTSGRSSRSKRVETAVMFEHIPREQNVLSDELARSMAVQCQGMAIDEFIQRVVQQQQQQQSVLLSSVNNKNLDFVDNWIDYILQPIFYLDAPTQLVGLQCLAQLYYQNQCYSNLLVILDRMEALLAVSKDSQHSLDHVLQDDKAEAWKRDLAVTAYLYRRLVYEKKLDGRRSSSKEMARFHRTTRRFVQIHAEHIARLEASILLSLDNKQQPLQPSKVLLLPMETEMWSRLLRKTVWSAPVRLWFDDVTTATKPNWQKEWSHWTTGV
jgi:hypothetical protein